MTHMLNLVDLHAAAPGVLDVLFGGDGDFEGAPAWACALYSPLGRRYVTGWQRTEDTIWLPAAHGALVAHGQMALDCRVPSVAARLAGLCARAMDPAATGQAWLEPGAGIWSLRYRVSVGHDVISWRFTGRLLYGSSRGIGAPDLPADLPDVASFIAALVTALAPRIAALGGDR